MLLSLNLLKKYLDLPKEIKPKEIQLMLTKCTVEVEKTKDQGAGLNKVIVARIKNVEKHPGADKLKVVFLETGEKDKIIQVVCGGSNLKQGALVALAQPGAMVRWHGQGESVKLEKTKIRGVESFGMICAAEEIGLESEFMNQDGEIIDLSSMKLPLGVDLAKALSRDDVVIEIENKSLTNRPDLWSHHGIAREFSVIFGLKLKPLKLYQKSWESRKVKKLKIDIKEKILCPRYIGAVVDNITVLESPDWMQKELLVCGLHPINSIVDITNYVLMEVGQPMHVFDFEKIKDTNTKSETLNSKKNQKAEIVVRLAKPGEKILTLDGVERRLDKDNLVIADFKKPVAIAGIMGGQASGITNKTKTIVFESANFDAINIRKTSQKLGLRTEASNRYEKSLHPRLAEIGMRRAIELLKIIDPGAVVLEVNDKNHFKRKDLLINVDYDFLVKRIGVDVGRARVLKILKDLGFAVFSPKSSRKLKIKVPWWRSTGDISIPEDLVEEVARIYGYDNLSENPELVILERPRYQAGFELETKMKKMLSLGCAATEVFNYPWSDSIVLEKLQVKDRMVEVLNPPTGKNRFLQSSLIFNLIKSVEDNLRFFDSFKLFELARVFLPDKTDKFDGRDMLPSQPKKLAGVLVGDKKANLFFEAKGIIQEMIKLAGVKNSLIKPGKVPGHLDVSKSLAVVCDGKPIGFLGVFRKDIAQKFDFHNKEVVVFEVDFDELVGLYENKPVLKYQHLDKQPSVVRDVSVKVDYAVSWQEMVTSIENIDPLIRRIEFLSVFDFGSGKKSVAFRTVYYSEDRTLKEEDVAAVEKKILIKLKSLFGAEVR